jgi:hypothetical protein
MQQTARERNMIITCQIVKTNAKIFQYGGRNVEWKSCRQDHDRELKHSWTEV